MDNSENNTMKQNELSLHPKDLIILRQFLEKGFRENFFTYQEVDWAKYMHRKLDAIIKDIVRQSGKSQSSHLDENMPESGGGEVTDNGRGI